MTALIGALRVALSADTANFEAGMKRAQRQTQTSASAIGKSMGVIKSAVAGFVSGLSVGLFVNVIKGALEYAASLAEVAQQVGVTARDLQVLRFAGSQVGVSTEEMDKGLQKFTKSLGDARNGSAEAIKTFKAIGFTDQDIAKLDVHDALMKTADGISAVGDRASRASPEVRLFGKAGQQLDPLLSQGSKGMNALAAAAEKLGIVLSDEQIRNADDTADKLTALKTVLQANIAGAVANNANAILGLANALVFLVNKASAAIDGLRILYHELKAFDNALGFDFKGYTNEMNQAKAIREGGIAYGVGSVTMKLPPAKPKGGAAPAGEDIGKFLATGGGGGGGGGRRARAGGGGGGGEDRSAQDALNKSYQFDQELRSSQMDVLRATQDLAADYVERTAIGIQILDAEKASKDAELQYQVKLFELTKGKDGMSQAQAAQLKAQNDLTDSLERQKLIQDEEEQRAREYNELDQHDFDRKREVLQSQASIATTAAERRKIELQLLDLAYQQKKQALQNILDTSKDFKEIEDARRDLANLKKTYAADRQGVVNNTRSPLAEYAATLPLDAERMNQALENVAVNGLKSLDQGLVDVLMGTKKVKDAFHEMAAAILADLLHIAIQKYIIGTILSVAGVEGAKGGGLPGFSQGGSIKIGGGLPGFATGGSITIGGKGGVDQNLLSLNGLPIARVSQGERINVTNDNEAMSGMAGVSVTMHNDFRGADPSAVASIKAHLDQLESSLPSRIAGTMKDVDTRTFGNWRR